jgi:hypothetical protein
VAVTNDPTGRVSDCTRCGAKVEEALLLKGLRVRERDPKNPDRTLLRRSPGIAVWRTLDRGHACTVCTAGGQHQPGRVGRASARARS